MESSELWNSQFSKHWNVTICDVYYIIYIVFLLTQHHSLKKYWVSTMYRYYSGSLRKKENEQNKDPALVEFTFLQRETDNTQ